MTWGAFGERSALFISFKFRFGRRCQSFLARRGALEEAVRLPGTIEIYFKTIDA